MASGSLMDALGAGAYGQSQQYQNYLAQNVFGQLTSATNSTTSLYGIPQQFPYNEYMARTFIPNETPAPIKKCEECAATSGQEHLASCELMKDRCECHSGRASKIHGALWKLRREITAWHGDVLERRAA